MVFLAGRTAIVTTQAISSLSLLATFVMMVVMIQQLVAGIAHNFRCCSNFAAMFVMPCFCCCRWYRICDDPGLQLVQLCCYLCLWVTVYLCLGLHLPHCMLLCFAAAGGTAFVTTQAISWSIFAATFVMMVVMIQQLVAGVAHCFRCWAIGAGTCMVTAQAVSVLLPGKLISL